jgi:hypothetical protein
MEEQEHKESVSTPLLHLLVIALERGTFKPTPAPLAPEREEA